MNAGTHTDYHLEWSWPTSISSYGDDLAQLLTESVKDDGILGYALAMCSLTVDHMPNARHVPQASKAYLHPRIRRARAVFGCSASSARRRVPWSVRGSRLHR